MRNFKIYPDGAGLGTRHSSGKIFSPFIQNDEATQIWQYSRLCCWKGSHIAGKGAELSKLQQEDFDATFRISQKWVRSTTQLPKYDPLSLQLPYENFIEAEIMYTKKILFYGLIFSKILFIVNLWYCKNFIQSEKKKPELFHHIAAC